MPTTSVQSADTFHTNNTWTMMSRLLRHCLFLTVAVEIANCQIYTDRPKIKSKDGDLILEPAFDKSIYFLTNGPQSTVFVGDVNLLNISVPNNVKQYTPVQNDDIEQLMKGRNGILQRLQTLESQNVILPSDLQYNISTIWTRINRLTNRIHNLQLQLNNRAKDDCQPHTCQNGGTCLNLLNGYHCLCPSNWEGRNCEVDVNECRNFVGTDLGCQNGAICINRPGTYECLCRSGWLGVHCTRREKDCSGGNYEMCGHGTCIPVTSGEGIKCICDQGWTTNGTGVACLTDVNECDTSQGPRCSINPKVECINLPGSFRCGQCPPGYDGDGYSCYDINECQTIPNGGCSPLVACHNTIGSRICGLCPPGYVGDGITCSWRGSCNINHGGCHPSAQCIENAALGGQTAQCICPDGMDGDGIGLHGCYVSAGYNSTLNCEDNPCGPHGQCHVLRTGYTCLCYRGFTGARCNIPLDYCANNPCQNGGVCRTDETMARGFRCECTALYTGIMCQVRARNCGGLLDNEEGSIIYPISNTTYEHNSKCAWVIHTAPNKVINVTFSKFNLELEPECRYDFLQMHDGQSSSSQLIGRFCGNTFPKGGNIISSHNNLYLWFRSDKTVARDGFALHWNSIDPICGGEINATTHGHISSPGSPGKYPPNRDCYWHLTTSYGKKIQLHFFEFDIEAHANCSYDYLAIYDGEHSTDPLLNKYCNSTQPAPTQSAGSELLIHFHSDAYSSGHGFQIAYAPIDGVPGCGGYFTGEQGDIVSPSYNGLYLNNLLCEYKIKTGPDTKIKIEIKSFNLERSLKCIYDYLKIYDGPSSDSRLVGKFCGNVYYPKSYISSSNSLFIIFKTDRTKSSEGFRISYKTICQYSITGDSGVIKSPGYPFNYPGNKVCEYIIETIPGKAIQLTFQDFDIEDNRYYNCQYDNIEIRDGPNMNSTLLGIFCGSADHTPPTQTSTHNFLYLKFTSDISISGTGFYANYTTIDVECGGIYKQTTGLINHPSGDTALYNNGQNCTWMLIAPEGMHIKLSWNRFDLEEMPSCDSDYLEIIEIDNNNMNETMGKYCGTVLPPAITTMTNRLMLQFVSDRTIRSAGFSVSYTFLNEKTHCGGTYVKTHGFIYSPGWPKNYEANRDCTWTIKVPAGQQISLNVSQFDLERSIRNKCDIGDYLEIRNGATENAPLIGKYCGYFNWKRFISTGNSLYLHFHSDFYMGGAGFKIEWDGTLQGCGGTLTSSSGSISSPNYPEVYNENAECFYKIITSHGSRIRINFKELDLERTPHCRDDYVEIFDGRDANADSLGKFCYMSPAANSIHTTTNIAFIKFRSDFYMGGKGFLLDYTTVCMNNITGSYGVIESPDYPNNYPFNLNCLWTINVSKGSKINITFTHFDIYKSFHRPHYRRWWSTPRRPGCERDYLQLKEPSQLQEPNKLCGTSIPSALSTTDNTLQIKFVTGFFNFHSGFRLEWVRYGCGGHIKKSYGTLYKTIDSNGELECEWIIEAQAGMSIFLALTKLYVADSENCTTDSLEIYNGPNIQSPLITKICHKKDVTIQGNTNFLFVRLIKQSTLKNVHFEIQYSSSKSVCGGVYNSATGFITSKNYPKNYENNMDCTWSITVTANRRIELNFLDFDLYSIANFESDSSICGDSIRIYDSTDISNANYTSIICPNTGLSQYISKSNTLLLQFVTDNYGTAKGFKANFSETCGATITAVYEGIITNDKFISRTNLSCIWTILAPTPDKKISLTITHISLPYTNEISNRSCPSSFLRIYDGNDENAPLIDEYCGHKIPSMIVSHGSAITVKLGTNTNKIIGHFSAHYTATDSACGGTLTSEEGAIASPGFPRSYPINTDCEWILKTSPGNKVYLTFESFKIEYSEQCNQDYLEIRENNAGGRLLGVYCGDNIPINTTIASELFIKFHSDNIYSDQGFFIRYGFIHGNEITNIESGEIASPLYPYPYDRPSEYWWRITSGVEIITLIIDKLEIHTYGEICYSSLTIYDGHDDEAPVLGQLCGILSEEKVIHTSSNAVYIKLSLHESNSGGLFHLRWAQENKITETDSSTFNCGSNDTKIITPGHVTIFRSPNYPKNYDDNLNCQWIFKAIPGQHLILNFNDFQLEEINSCFADSISIYKSDDPSQWTPIKENICTADITSLGFNSSMYLKVNFRTDSSVTRKGFQAQVRSVCGGTFTDLSGVFGPTMSDYMNIYQPTIRCNWIVKVRPGKHIKLNFEYFNITNKDNECKTFVVLHNGDSMESPLLSSGKYCGYSHENTNEVVTSSNALFVSYESSFFHNPQHMFQTFKIRYEEEGVYCGTVSKLDIDHPWEIISSPNYPSIPDPYTECIWKFSGPLGEILKIDFIDRFDLDYIEDCPTESIEIHDGLSDLAPLKGKFCGEKPGTIKTSSNTLYIKYFTALSEPKNGFKANISIDVCGGTVFSPEGELKSPGYPNMVKLSSGTVCEWRLRGKPRHILFIKVLDLDLPESESPCGTKVTIEENLPGNHTVVSELKTFCGDDIVDVGSVVETSTNEVTIKLHLGKPSEYTAVTQSRGFRFTFNTSVPSCNGIITTPEGYLTTPGYPRETSIRQCQWRIIVPDKKRRVRLELLDFAINKQRIGIYNDKNFQTSIGYVSNSYNTTIFESSGNELALYVWLNSYGETHRFKARFSSDQEALCGGTLGGVMGELVSPILDRSYSCNWQYNPNLIRDFKNYSTLYITATVNSSVTRTRCRYADPKLKIKSANDRGIVGFHREICGNTEMSYRIPTTVVDYRATKSHSDSFYFRVQWKLQQCGGFIHAGDNAVNIINIPNAAHNDTIDCAWNIELPLGNKIELKLEGSFLLECADEFIKISRNVAFSAYIGDYCKNKMQDTVIIESFSNVLVEYHSNPKNSTNIKLMVKTTRHSCGAFLGTYDRIFASPNYPNNYPNNQECSWEIKSDLGFRISLSFINRFGIESRPNCTKDAVIIYDWKDEVYTEIARLCGRDLPPIYNSTYNRMKVVLRTDDDINLYGFQAMWNPLCGGTYVATEKEQFLYSPGYPYGYRPHMDCTYTIKKSVSGQKISINFLEFDVEGPYPSCESDNVTISSIGEYEYYYDTYCGKEIPHFTPSYEDVIINFKTDTFVQRKGFKLSFSLFSCGGQIREPKILTAVPLGNYYNNMNCTWLIEGPKNKTVALKLRYVDLENNYMCRSDYLAVFDGLIATDDKRLALICGSDNSTTVIRSTGNTMVLQFITDGSMVYKGFKADVFFSYSESVGCGGKINMLPTSSYVLKSPFINSKKIYENYLDCHWKILAPADYSIKIQFMSFHIAPCKNENQTALGYKCDCDLVEIKNGINPDSYTIGTYCGHILPPPLTTSSNEMSVRLSTDGEIVSSGFEATLTVQRSQCGQSKFNVSYETTTIKSPGYDMGLIPRESRCIYHLITDNNMNSPIHIRIVNLDLKPGTSTTECDKDKLVLSVSKSVLNTPLGKDYIIKGNTDEFYVNMASIVDFNTPKQITLCGSKKMSDIYVSGSVTIHLETSPDYDTTKYQGVSMEVSLCGVCGKNYTERQGRIKTAYSNIDEGSKDCYTLITAPENYTISLYFISVNPDYWSKDVFLDIYDGNNITSTKVVSINTEYYNNPVFSSGRYLLIHSHQLNDAQITYDLNYVVTNKGRGCGGQLFNEQGIITSPLYPDIYRKKNKCEWELETPVGTRLALHFSTFDLGKDCDNNYVEIVNKQGNSMSTFCSETPADYISTDNYVKIVFITTMNNGGSGWVAEFVGIL
ncbi:cubilin [Galleria mellonella]|uniref:Cubilin n=1 Tax=Galleria mellonella TaxID=7137 RepID=A0A6J1WEK7_GALME|nr:cubilin [Galleria mellonella]